ncbi:MAG: DoxX family membrane protein [Desulfobacterales bacterium]|nr:DoxX family membrane protein [Desulfobacterales bacterium]
MAYVTLVLRVLIGAILLTSAFGKMTYTGSRALAPQMAETLNVFIFIPLTWIHFYVSALPWLELTIALFILLGLYQRIFAALFVMMVITFIISNGVFLYYDNLSSCHCCFGDLASLKLPESLALDVMMLAAGLWLVCKGQNGLFSVDVWRKDLHIKN